MATDDDNFRSLHPNGSVAIAIAAIAAAAPLTAAIYGWTSKSKEIEIADTEQRFKVRMAFLDRATDPQRPPQDRKVVLRFLRATDDDEKMRAWASDELQTVTAEAAELERSKVR